MTASHPGTVFGPTSGLRSVCYGVGWGRIVKESGPPGAAKRLDRVAHTRDVLSSASIRATMVAPGTMSPHGRRRALSPHRCPFEPRRPPARRCLRTRRLCWTILSVCTGDVFTSRETTIAKAVTISRVPTIRHDTSFTNAAVSSQIDRRIKLRGRA